MRCRRIVILFGAGASYDSDGSDGFGHRPPRGFELFDRLRSHAMHGHLKESNGWADPSLVNLFTDPDTGTDFEQGMVRVRGRNLGKQIWPLMRDMERYIWQFNLPTDNTYSALFGQLLDHGGFDITLSTLNYDLLMEIAIYNSGWGWRHARFDGLNGNSDRVLDIFKLHGSVNWVTDGVCAVEEMSDSPSTIGSPIHSVAQYSDFEARLSGPRNIRDDRGAIMSMYEPEKLVLPEGWLVDEVQAEWQAHVREADVVLCIGVRPIEGGDPHIWNPIAEHSGATLVSVDPGKLSRQKYLPVAGPNRTPENGRWVHLNEAFGKAVRTESILDVLRS